MHIITCVILRSLIPNTIFNGLTNKIICIIINIMKLTFRYLFPNKFLFITLFLIFLQEYAKIISDRIRNRIACHTITFYIQFRMKQRVIREETLPIILGQVHLLDTLSHILTRQVQCIRTCTQMFQFRMKHRLDGRVLLGRCRIGWQLLQYLIGMFGFDLLSRFHRLYGYSTFLFEDLFRRCRLHRLSHGLLLADML